MVNDAACRLLGCSREELLTMTVSDFDPEFSVEDYKERYWSKVRQLGTINFESRHRRKDGSTYPVEILSCYVQFEGAGYSCTFFRDITERKRAESALQESEHKLSAIINHHLTDELAGKANRFMKKGLTGYDACYVALALDLKSRWLTFDKNAHKLINNDKISCLLSDGLPKGW